MRKALLWLLYWAIMGIVMVTTGQYFLVLGVVIVIGFIYGLVVPDKKDRKKDRSLP